MFKSGRHYRTTMRCGAGGVVVDTVDDRHYCCGHGNIMRTLVHYDDE